MLDVTLLVLMVVVGAALWGPSADADTADDAFVRQVVAHTPYSHETPEGLIYLASEVCRDLRGGDNPAPIIEQVSTQVGGSVSEGEFFVQTAQNIHCPDTLRGVGDGSASPGR